MFLLGQRPGYAIITRPTAVDPAHKDACNPARRCASPTSTGCGIDHMLPSRCFRACTITNCQSERLVVPGGVSRNPWIDCWTLLVHLRGAASPL
jgi:hypothetical protein